MGAEAPDPPPPPLPVGVPSTGVQHIAQGHHRAAPGTGCDSNRCDGGLLGLLSPLQLAEPSVTAAARGEEPRCIAPHRRRAGSSEQLPYSITMLHLGALLLLGPGSPSLLGRLALHLRGEVGAGSHPPQRHFCGSPRQEESAPEEQWAGSERPRQIRARHPEDSRSGTRELLLHQPRSIASQCN